MNSKIFKISKEPKTENSFEYEKKLKWSKEEDEFLLNYQKNIYIKNWKYLTNDFFQRFGNSNKTKKLLRERYNNFLNPNLKKEKLSQEEKNLIMESYQSIGSRWSFISKQIPGRSDQKIKNFYYSNLRIKIRKILKNIIQKEEKNDISKTQLRLMSKNSFNKIYPKLIKKKINYFQINENDIEKIMKENEEQKNNKHCDSLQISFSHTKKSQNTCSEKDISFSNDCFKFEDDENLFSKENTIENLFYQEQLNQKFNIKEENFILEKNIDLFKPRFYSQQSDYFI